MAKVALGKAEAETGLYERDYFLWVMEQAELLRQGRVDALDLDNLAEEVEDIGRSQRRAAESEVGVILIHLLKYQFQPTRRSRSWLDSLLEHRGRLTKDLRASASLKRHLEDELGDVYRLARKRAAVQTRLPLPTFPDTCPYSLEQLLDEDFLPEG